VNLPPNGDLQVKFKNTYATTETVAQARERKQGGELIQSGRVSQVGSFSGAPVSCQGDCPCWPVGSFSNAPVTRIGSFSDVEK